MKKLLFAFNFGTTETFNSAAIVWQVGLQDSLTPIMDAIIHFHSHLMFFLVGIGTFVFWLLGRCISFYRESSDHQVDNFTHSTLLEATWTIVPAVILLFIAVPSYGLLYSMDELSDTNITVKVIGNQWYWVYEFSDFVSITGKGSDLVFDSYMIGEDDLSSGSFRLLEVDNRLVLPVSNHVRLLVTAADVLHSWAVPSLGIKIDACPGRLNQVNIFLNRVGVAYGQCSELCGVNHGFMPICVEVQTKENFEAWLMSKLDLEELPVESPKTIESSSNKQEGAKIPKGYMDAMCSPDGVLNDKIRQEFLDNLRKIKFTAPTPYRPFDESIFTDPQCAPFKIFFETLYKPEYTDIGIDELMKKLTILDENGALVEYNGKEMLRILRSTTLDTCTDQDKVILILLNLYVGEYPMESKKQGLKLLEAVINNADI